MSFQYLHLCSEMPDMEQHLLGIFWLGKAGHGSQTAHPSILKTPWTESHLPSKRKTNSLNNGLVQKWRKWCLMKFSTLTRLSLLSLHNFWENLAFHAESHFCTRQKWHKRILIKFSSLPTLSSSSLHNPWEN